MQAYLDQLIQQGYFAGVPKEAVYAVAMVLAAFVVLSVFVAPLAGITSWLERRVWARMQSRVGPNRVEPQGILQWLADGIKNLLKEDLIPAAAYSTLFSLRRDSVRQPAHCRRSEHRYPIHFGGHISGCRGDLDGRLGFQQQMVLARRHALRCPDREL